MESQGFSPTHAYSNLHQQQLVGGHLQQRNNPKLLHTQMKLFDKVDIAIFTIITSLLSICLLAIAYMSGAANVQQKYRKEAIERDFAHYVVDSSGKTEFRWKTPVGSAESINNKLVRISL